MIIVEDVMTYRKERNVGVCMCAKLCVCACVRVCMYKEASVVCLVQQFGSAVFVCNNDMQMGVSQSDANDFIITNNISTVKIEL